MKVTHRGETKRLKLPADYQELVQSTRSAFVSHELPEAIKFYYLDDENDLISVSCQNDYLEALVFTDVLVLKLAVTKNAPDAREQLLALLEERKAVRDSSSQLSDSRRASTMDFMLGNAKLENLTDKVTAARCEVPDKLVASEPKMTKVGSATASRDTAIGSPASASLVANDFITITEEKKSSRPATMNQRPWVKFSARFVKESFSAKH